MWPWEHAIVGYLAYSLFSHAYYRVSPSGPEALAVVVASVLPDVIDKPLAWEYGVFESGYALGHSLFFAVPLAIVAGALARRLGRTRVGLAVAVGYLVHLPSDVIDDLGRRGVFQPEIVLWPAVVVSGGQTRDFREMFAALFDAYQGELASGDPSTYLLAQLGLAGFAVLVWLADGAPVLNELVRYGVRLARSSVRWASGR